MAVFHQVTGATIFAVLTAVIAVSGCQYEAGDEASAPVAQALVAESDDAAAACQCGNASAGDGGAGGYGTGGYGGGVDPNLGTAGAGGTLPYLGGGPPINSHEILLITLDSYRSLPAVPNAGRRWGYVLVTGRAVDSELFIEPWGRGLTLEGMKQLWFANADYSIQKPLADAVALGLTTKRLCSCSELDMENLADSLGGAASTPVGQAKSYGSWSGKGSFKELTVFHYNDVDNVKWSLVLDNGTGSWPTPIGWGVNMVAGAVPRDLFPQDFYLVERRFLLNRGPGRKIDPTRFYSDLEAPTVKPASIGNNNPAGLSD